MNELSLFTGAGGGLLGTKLLGGRRHVGYVEWNPYCQRVLAQRIADGYLDPAPIYGDLRAFISEGYAEEYQGMVDILNAGFPCQFVSVAGQQLVEFDPRNMWPPTRDAIRIIRPRKVELENVPGLVTTGYIRRVLADLASLGYVGSHGCISAGATGADHERERVWIAAYADGERQQGPGHVGNPSIQRRMRIGKQVGLSMLFKGPTCPSCVEAMMDFPIGWTALQPLAMPSFQAWLQTHGGFSHESR